MADNGSDWYFQGTVDDGWTNGLMDQLKRVPAGAFVAVNEAGCKVSSGSGQYAYGPNVPVAQPGLTGHCTRPKTARSLVCVSAPSGGTTVLPYTP